MEHYVKSTSLKKEQLPLIIFWTWLKNVECITISRSSKDYSFLLLILFLWGEGFLSLVSIFFYLDKNVYFKNTQPKTESATEKKL